MIKCSSFAWNAVKRNYSLISFAGEYPLETAHRLAAASDGKVSQQSFYSHSEPVESQLINRCLQLSLPMCDALNVIFSEVSAHTCNWDWPMAWVVVVAIQQVRSLYSRSLCKISLQVFKKFLATIIREVSLECSRRKFRPDALRVSPHLHILARWIRDQSSFLLDLDERLCHCVPIMWTWKLLFNRIWKCVFLQQQHRLRAYITRLRCPKFEKRFCIRAPSRSGGQQLLSADELCDTPPGLLFQYSRGAGQAPPRESRLYHFRALKSSRPALLLPAQRKRRRREVYPAPSKKKKAWVWRMHYLFRAGSTGSWKSTT